MSLFRCSVCGGELERTERTYRCGKNHSFDISKEGYTYLLPPNQKHSAAPGDDKEMSRSRWEFLSKGYYAPLLEALCQAAEAVWTARLRDGVSVESCEEAFCCAAAFTAAADYAVGQEADGVSGFSAGEVSVQMRNGNGRTAVADALRQTAERLMAPYAEPEDFCFKGVWG